MLFGSRLAVVSSVLVSTIEAINIPPRTGHYRYQVGINKHVIEHLNANDPTASGNVSPSFLATIFYPTAAYSHGASTPYLNPGLGSLYEARWNFTPGLLASLTSTVQKDAPFLSAGDQTLFSTLLFGGGGGGHATECYTILVSELASHGYTVVGLDHPWTTPLIEEVYAMRMQDTAVFLDHLPKLAEELEAPFNTSYVGAFGGSLGGAAAVGSAYDDERILSAINMDGTFFGRAAVSTSDADVQKPTLMLGMEGHTGVNASLDITWGTFPRWQTDYFRKILVKGATHRDFSDITFWKTVRGSVRDAGPINGTRQVETMNAIVRAFFDFTLLGIPSPVLDAPSKEFPDLIFHGRNKPT
ncbi:Uu.00g048210.m01.CDS01 [Anthostomella pinea]|uniref:1-alkyl-2-acetylglycerophosphocholine esterase n=1 Tax=Anthostomella pinea TaxID=933095 RepID=A0AAI8V6N1_9PEZI|nr:Uu.00g048210.m01.CDS01 [Anthostomella pinea]